MKKCIGILTAAALLLSMMFVPASAVTQESDFETSANWKLYSSNSTYFNENGTLAGAWAQVTSNTNSAYTYKGGTASVKVSAISQWATFSLNVQKNRDYVLSFRYYSEALNSAGTYIVSQVGVMLPNSDNAFNTDGWLHLIASNVAYTTPDGTYANRTVASERTLTTDTSVWHEVNLTFNSGENETLTLAILSAVNTLYLDAFVLTDRTDELFIENYFETSENWTLNGSASTNIGTRTGAAEKSSWTNITKTTDPAYTLNSAASICVNANAQWSSIELPNIKANTYYTLSFDYYSTDPVSASSHTYFNPVGIFAPDMDGANLSNSQASQQGFLSCRAYSYAYTTADGTAATQTDDSANKLTGQQQGAWNHAEFVFSSGEFTTLALVMYHGFASGYKIYLDNFLLTATDDWDFTAFSGNSMRASGNQALRYSYTVDRALLADGAALLDSTVVEYGCVAIRKDYLQGAELVKGGVYTYGGKERRAVSGAAYLPAQGIDIYREQTETETKFSAALYNIGYSTTTGSTNYDAYGYEYAVRPYAVLQKDGKTFTVYDDTENATVFAVMQAILSGSSETDIAAVNQILENTEVNAKYEAWLASK